MHNITDRAEVTPSALSPFQYMVLNTVLHANGFEACTPMSVPDKVVSACLRCGTTTEAPDVDSRDVYVENFDFQCCGLTVTFHSALFLLPMALLSVALN
jgi:hypothetical protein